MASVETDRHEAPVNDGAPALFDRRILAGLTLIASLMFVFILSTVNRRPLSELQAHSAAKRSAAIFSFWREHGYFSLGGMVALPAPPGQSSPFVFYRSTPGGWMLPGYVVARVSTAIERRYDWLLLARFNLAIGAIIATLLGWLASGIAVRLGLSRTHAFALGVSVLAVNFTFPDVLAFYWEPSPQAWALGLWVVFLILEEVRRSLTGRGLRRTSAVQAACVFAFVYVDYVTSVLFVAAYTLATVLLVGRSFAWRSWLLRIAAPAGAALLIFAAQLTYVRARYADIPMVGSSFMQRTGLDGATDYYQDHSDIIKGRDVARRNFPYNHEQLFNWKWLFLVGILSFVLLLGLHSRSRLPDILMVPLIVLTATYVLYGAVFSQATVIHPYLFDILLAAPVIVAVFSAVPAVIESATDDSGAIVLVALFAAIWYSMIQLRSYALWYPLAPPSVVAQPAGAGSENAASQAQRSGWIEPPFDAARFSATTGEWKVEPNDVTTFAYTRIGKTMVINFKLLGTTLTARTTTLQVHLPDQATSVRRVETPFMYSADGVAFNVGQIVVVPDQQMMYLEHLGAASDFFPAKETAAVAGSITFETK